MTKELQKVTRGYKEDKILQRCNVTGGYKGLQKVTRGYGGLQGATKGYFRLQGVTEVKKGYRGLKRVI